MTELCKLCKFEIIHEYNISYCSEFCLELSDKDKQDFLNLKPGEFGLWPCSECGCMIEDDYTIGGWCSGCSPKVNLRKANEEILRLKSQINTPQTNDFWEAVKTEAAHQRERWTETDAKKSDSDWFWLIGYLAGKALHNPGDDIDKKKHRIITVAAAACNWWMKYE